MAASWRASRRAGSESAVAGRTMVVRVMEKGYGEGLPAVHLSKGTLQDKSPGLVELTGEAA